MSWGWRISIVEEGKAKAVLRMDTRGHVDCSEHRMPVGKDSCDGCKGLELGCRSRSLVLMLTLSAVREGRQLLLELLHLPSKASA